VVPSYTHTECDVAEFSKFSQTGPTIKPTEKIITTVMQGSQEQEVKFQDPIFRKFQDIFVGFTRLKTQKLHVFLSS